MKRLLTLVSVLLVLAPIAPAVSAQSSAKVSDASRYKLQIIRLGVGDKAKATITTKDGAKIRGYIAEVRENEFVLRDRKTNTATTIGYADVTKVDGNRGHSIMRNVLIMVGIGTAVTLVAVYAAIVRNG